MDRGKLGVKRSLAIEGHGVPVGLVLAGANRHDCQLLEATLANLAAVHPAPTWNSRSTRAWIKATHQ